MRQGVCIRCVTMVVCVLVVWICSVKFVSLRVCVDVRCGDVYMLLRVGGCVCEPQKSVRTQKIFADP